ncbi:MAG: right-handed parallel beta-helix repeat-containing protein [Candidatus Micrarchaeia archaeon]
MNAPLMLTFGLLAMVQSINITHFEGLNDDFSNLVLEVDSANHSYYAPHNITSFEPGAWALVSADLPDGMYELNAMSSADANFSASYEPNIIEISYSPAFKPDFSNLAVQFESDGKSLPVSYSVVGMKEGDWVIVALERAPLGSESISLLAKSDAPVFGSQEGQDQGTSSSGPSAARGRPPKPLKPFDFTIHDSKGKKVDFDVAADIGTSDSGDPEELHSLLPRGMSVKKIVFSGLNGDSGGLGLEMLPAGLPALGGKNWSQAYAIDPTALNFSSANVSVIAAGNALFKCMDWDFPNRSCNGEWVKVREDLVPGQEYSINLTPDDPAFGEMYIAVINVFSTPAAGGNWTVYFNTSGQADLMVRASNGTTWDDLDQDVDLNFLELRCGSSVLSPIWDDALKAVIQPAYQCDENGSITSKVISASNHALRFSFWLSEDYAYNDVVNITNCTAITANGTYSVINNLSGAPVTALPAFSGNACIKINASNVSLDCGGYSISNNGTAGTTFGVLMSGPIVNITLMNCGNISNYSNGVYLYRTNQSAIRNVTLSSNVGISFDQAANNTVDVSSIRTNATSGYGLYLLDEQSDANIITNTTVTTLGSSASGIYFSGGADNNTFSGVNISTNSSSGYGIYMAGSSGDNNFTGMRIVSPTYAIYLQSGLPNNTIERSYLESNGPFIRTFYLYFSTGTRILYNVINQSNTSGYSALILDNSDNTTVIGNNMSNSCTAFAPENCAVMDIYRSSGASGSNNSYNNTNQLSFWLSGITASQYNHSFSDDTGDGVPVYLIGGKDPRTSVSGTVAKEIWVAKDNFTFDNITMSNAELITYSFVRNATLNNVSFNATMGTSLGAVRYDNTTMRRTTRSATPSSSRAYNGSIRPGIPDEISDGNRISNTSILPSGSSAYGIYIYGGADNNTFSGVNITTNVSNSYGYYSSGSSGGNNFTGGRIVTPYYSVYISSALANNTFERSYLESNGSFIRTVYIYFSTGTRILYNVINQSNTSGYSALILDNSDNTTVIGNNMSNSCTSFQQENCAVMDIYRSSGASGSNNSYNNTNQLSFWLSGITASQYNHSFSDDTGDGVPVYLIGGKDPRTSVSGTVAKEIWVAKDNFTFDNITMSNAELITYSFVRNATLNNVSFNATMGTSLGAVRYDNASNNTLSNSFIVTSNNSRYGLEFPDETSDGNRISNTSILPSGSSAYGIYIYGGADNNTFSGVNITTNVSNSYGYYSSGSSGGNNFTGGRIVTPYYSVYISSALANNTFERSYIESNGLNIQAMYLYFSPGTRVLYNIINQSNTTGFGAVVVDSSGNSSIISNNMTSARTGYFAGSGALLYLAATNTTVFDNNFSNPNQDKIYFAASSGASAITGNFFGPSNGSVSASSFAAAAGLTSVTQNLSGNLLVGPRIDIDGFQFNLTNNTFRAIDASDEIFYPSLLFNGSATFRLNESNLFVGNNVTAVNPASASLGQSFNTSAQARFFGQNCSNFSIHYNSSFVTNFTAMNASPAVASQTDAGWKCRGNVCRSISCTNSTVAFTVPSWSSFAVVNSSSVNCPNPFDEPANFSMSMNFSGAPNPAAKGNACVLVNSSNVSFDCNGYGIRSNGTVNDTGISAENSTNVTIKNCGIISDYSYGLTIIKTNQSIISNLSTSNATQYALFINGSTDDRLESIATAGANNGFNLISSPRNNFTDNTFELLANQAFVIDATSHYNRLINNSMSNSSAFSAMDLLSQNNTVSGNNVTNYVFGTALNLYAAGNNVSDNRVRNASLGFNMLDSPRNNFTDNTFELLANQAFVIDATSHYNRLINNSMSNSSAFSAMDLLSQNNTVSGNNVTNYVFGTALNLYAAGNNVSDNRVRNASLGFNMLDSPRNNFTDNTFELLANQAFVIDATSHYNRLINNSMSNSSAFSAMDLLSQNNTVSGNNVTNYVFGTALNLYAAGNNVSDNRVRNASLGFNMLDSPRNNFTDNTFELLANQAFVIDATSHYNRLINNSMSNSSAFSAMDLLSQNNTVSGNNVTNYVFGTALNLYAAGNNVSDNRVRNASLGFNMLDSPRNNFTDNTFELLANQAFVIDATSHYNRLINNSMSNGTTGVSVLSQNNTFDGNSIRNQSGYGFEIYSGGSNYSGNSVTSSGTAFYMLDSTSGNFTNNTAANNSNGFVILSSTGMSLSSNNITGNSMTGIRLNASSGLNSLGSNYVCSNGLDVNSQNSSNSGSLDRCDSFLGWSENGHFGCEFSCSTMWHRFFGDVNGTIILGDNATGPYIYSWNGSGLNIYFADYDSAISWQSLQAVGRNALNGPSADDFNELDAAFNTTGYQDNINKTYSSDGSNPLETMGFTVFQKPISLVPVANSTVGNTTFRTGILWDMSDGGSEYSLNQSTVWVVKVNSSASDLYGTYDYLVQVPRTLATYEGTNDIISVYIELQ